MTSALTPVSYLAGPISAVFYFPIFSKAFAWFTNLSVF